VPLTRIKDARGRSGAHLLATAARRAPFASLTVGWRLQGDRGDNV
jgi:hypothetical protein